MRDSLRRVGTMSRYFWRGLRVVDPGGIEPPPQQCECCVIPLYYGPASLKFLQHRVYDAVLPVQKINGDKEGENEQIGDCHETDVAPVRLVRLVKFLVVILVIICHNIPIIWKT